MYRIVNRVAVNPARCSHLDVTGVSNDWLQWNLNRTLSCRHCQDRCRPSLKAAGRCRKSNAPSQDPKDNALVAFTDNSEPDENASMPDEGQDVKNEDAGDGTSLNDDFHTPIGSTPSNYEQDRERALRVQRNLSNEFQGECDADDLQTESDIIVQTFPMPRQMPLLSADNATPIELLPILNRYQLTDSSRDWSEELLRESERVPEIVRDPSSTMTVVGDISESTASQAPTQRPRRHRSAAPLNRPPWKPIFVGSSRRPSIEVSRANEVPRAISPEIERSDSSLLGAGTIAEKGSERQQDQDENVAPEMKPIEQNFERRESSEQIESLSSIVDIFQPISQAGSAFLNPYPLCTSPVLNEPCLRQPDRNATPIESKANELNVRSDVAISTAPEPRSPSRMAACRASRSEVRDWPPSTEYRVQYQDRFDTDVHRRSIFSRPHMFDERSPAPIIPMFESEYTSSYI